jgi:hypothetical protein
MHSLRLILIDCQAPLLDPDAQVVLGANFTALSGISPHQRALHNNPGSVKCWSSKYCNAGRMLQIRVQ